MCISLQDKTVEITIMDGGFMGDFDTCNAVWKQVKKNMGRFCVGGFLHRQVLS